MVLPKRRGGSRRRRPQRGRNDPIFDDEDFVIDEEEDEAVQLSPEHASVEPVDDLDEAAWTPTKRPRRGLRMQPSAKVNQVEDEEDGEEDNSLLGRADDPDAHPPRLETTSLEQASLAFSMNAAYLSELRDQATYYRGVGGRPADDALLQRVERAMEDTLNAMQDWPMPVRQAGPVIHMVPPTIPEADGSEKRFTNVAASIGIKWSAISSEDKQRVYERALDLHVEHYGVRPSKVKMWTSDGFQPVYYYNEATYAKTMLQALQEYKESLVAQALAESQGRRHTPILPRPAWMNAFLDPQAPPPALPTSIGNNNNNNDPKHTTQ